MNVLEYTKELERTLSYSDEQWFFDPDLPDDLESTIGLTRKLLEDGGAAFYNPVFQKEIFSVFHDWYGDNKYLKVWMYANALLAQLPDDCFDDFRQRLTDYAQGNWGKYQDKVRCPWPDLPETYLKNWDWRMHEFSINYWDEKKKFYRMQRRLIFVQHPI